MSACLMRVLTPDDVLLTRMVRRGRRRAAARGDATAAARRARRADRLGAGGGRCPLRRGLSSGLHRGSSQGLLYRLVNGGPSGGANETSERFRETNEIEWTRGTSERGERRGSLPALYISRQPHRGVGVLGSSYRPTLGRTEEGGGASEGRMGGRRKDGRETARGSTHRLLI